MLESSQPGDRRFESPTETSYESIPQHIPLKRLARRLEVSPQTLRRWASNGTQGCPPVVILGDRNLHFRVDEVTEWLTARRLAAGDSDAQSS